MAETLDPAVVGARGRLWLPRPRPAESWALERIESAQDFRELVLNGTLFLAASADESFGSGGPAAPALGLGTRETPP